MAGEDIVLLTFALLPPVLLLALLLFRRLGLHRRSPRVLYLVVGNALVLLLLLSFFLLGGEVYYRFLYDGSQALGRTKVSRRWFEKYWHLNASGFRDTIDYLKRSPRQRRRVTFIGDSIAAGRGLPDVDTRFANLIRKARPRWEIHVVAKNGWNTLEEIDVVERLEEEEYSFDRVMLVYDIDDVAPLVPECRVVAARLRKAPDPGPFVRDSYLLDLLYQRILVVGRADTRRFAAGLKEGYRGEIWERQRERLMQLVRDVRAQGGQLSAVTVPYLEVGLGDGEFRPIHQTLAGLWRRTGVPHLDLGEVFRGHDPEDLRVSAHDACPNEKAHAMAAAAIAAFLDPLMERRRRSQ